MTTLITDKMPVAVDGNKDGVLMAPSMGGLIVSTLLTLATFVRPIHLFIPVILIVYGNLPIRLLGYGITLIFFISFIVPAKASPFLVRFLLSPVLEYFDYDEIVENTPINIQESIKDGRQYILACQPHGIVSFCGIASSIRQAQQERQITPTAVASMVLWTPILKHVMGIYGCKTTTQIRQNLKENETSCVRLYVGSTAEIFFCSGQTEVLELTKRKKFIQVALQMGVDVIPVYMFGNTSLFSMWKHKWLIKFSEWTNFPTSYIWGRYGLPIPKQQKVCATFCNLYHSKN